MRHLIICREYPPAPGGGIGTYTFHMSRLLAEAGETVHVISQLWERAEKEIEEKCNGRLRIHRVPFEDWTSRVGRTPNPAMKSHEARSLFESGYAPQCFSWQASLLAEQLVEQEGIDVIEAQEFEAPLYYFQLRRALGLGPKKSPPCIIHLHTSTEFVAHYNDQDVNRPYFQTAKRLEDYSIASADALLCPSRFLARQMEAYYGLAEGKVQVIPYPVGDTPLLERDPATWKRGTVCYVGRLERRKGILEWIDAAIAVAHEYPEARFEFIGANILGNSDMNGGKILDRRIPGELKTRFLFRGEHERSTLARFLAGARIAVVPSRWENFPNSCIEAMRSGLPVIASPQGGMSEMIEDGKTGWLAGSAGREGLTEALKRALATPATQIAEMGRRASVTIHQMCGNRKIVERQSNFRDRVVSQGAKRSLSLPANLPWAKRPLTDEPARRTSRASPKGLAVVVTCFNDGRLLEGCLQSLVPQTHKPAAVVVVADRLVNESALRISQRPWPEGWQVIHDQNDAGVPVKNAAVEAVLRSGLTPIGFAFLNTGDRLQPGFVAACESVLKRRPDVGLVSCWAKHSGATDKTWVKPCPAFPYQWIANEAGPFSAIRTEALLEVGKFRPGMNPGYDEWDLFNAVMAAGWIAVTLPEILGEHQFDEDSIPNMTDIHIYGRMRQELLERFPDLIKRDAKEIVLLAESMATWFLYQEHSTLRGVLARLPRRLRHPLSTALAGLGRAKNKILRRAPIGRLTPIVWHQSAPK